MDIILIGGGGHCRSVADAAESVGLHIAGVIERPGVQSDTLSYPVVGCDDDIASLAAAGYNFVVTLGSISDPSRRVALAAALEAAGGRAVTVVAATAHVSVHAAVADGTVVLHHAIVNAGARVGRHCIINSGAIVEHDCEVGDFTHVSTRATVNGGCCIGARCFIGSGAVLAHGVSIPDDTVIGAGSLVLHSIEKAGKYFGVI